MSDYLDLARFNLATLLVALAIGIAVARWMFRKPPSSPSDSEEPPQS